MVKYGGTHADECSAFHLASVQGDVVSYGDVIADDDGRLAVEGVEAGAVLNVHPVAQFDEMYVAAQHGIEPYGAVVAHADIAYDGRSFRKVAVPAESGSHVVEFLDKCHIL